MSKPTEPGFYWAFVEYGETCDGPGRKAEWETVRVGKYGLVTAFERAFKVLQWGERAERREY